MIVTSEEESEPSPEESPVKRRRGRLSKIWANTVSYRKIIQIPNSGVKVARNPMAEFNSGITIYIP